MVDTRRVQLLDVSDPEGTVALIEADVQPFDNTFGAP